MLWRLSELVEGHAEELAELDSLEIGLPFSITRIVDVPYAIDVFRYMAGWATKIEGSTIPVGDLGVPGASFFVYTVREPIGVVGQIVPWNVPLMMAAQKLAPALAAGCTVVLKPAEQTSPSTLRLGELTLEAGFPEGVVNVVTGFGETAGAALAAHPDVDKIAFTGSTEVGKRILHAATSNLKRVSLELGGKSPNVVFADADIEGAIPNAANAIFLNSGQVCYAGSRLYVEEGAYNEVVAGVSEHAEKLKLGPGLDPGTQMGPLVTEEQLERVSGYLGSGFSQGARAATGGGRIGDRGYFVEPTVLTNTSHDMKVVREEIFGPVVAAIPFKDIGQLEPLANDTPYGLAAGVWIRDLGKAHRAAARLKAGTVWINCYHANDPAIPFGGFKQSGWGRENNRAASELYSEEKSVVEISG